jgi:hypothetical protein
MLQVKGRTAATIAVSFYQLHDTGLLLGVFWHVWKWTPCPDQLLMGRQLLMPCM